MASTQDRAQERALSDDICCEMMWKCTSHAGCWFVKILYILFYPSFFVDTSILCFMCKVWFLLCILKERPSILEDDFISFPISWLFTQVHPCNDAIFRLANIIFCVYCLMQAFVQGFCIILYVECSCWFTILESWYFNIFLLHRGRQRKPFRFATRIHPGNCSDWTRQGKTR